MMREELVFGPIRSRRLGSSLGINLLPRKGKICNFDCIYCECGWNKDGLEDKTLPTTDELRHDLAEVLGRCRADGIPIDSITFSGDGEPTLHPDFAQMTDIAIALRDEFFPAARISVLSNATRVCRDSVFQALRKVDNPIMKIDAPTDELAARINQPQCDYSVRQIVEDLRRFEGDFVLQTMFLRGPDFDSSSPEVLDGWMRIVRELRPREIMVYTIDRETPMKGLKKIPAEEMEAMVRPLKEEGYRIQVKG